MTQADWKAILADKHIRGYSAIGLVNTKTEANVGGVLRASHCFGASLVAIQGKRYQKESTDTTSAWRHIPLIHTEDLRLVIPFDCVPIAIEITPNAKSIIDFEHPERAFYIFGPEDGSIPSQTIEWCKLVVKIPTRFCLNLASTVNVVLYDRLLKRLRK